MRHRLAAVAADPESCALVAVVDGEVAGMVLLTATDYAPLFEQRAVHAHYLHVKDGFRRRGVGKALLGAAVTYRRRGRRRAHHHQRAAADARDPAVLRPARLRSGRRPAVGAVSVLRRRLAPSGAASVTDNLLARRRSLRRVRAAVARVSD